MLHTHEIFFIALAFFSELFGTLSGVSSSSLFVPLGVFFESIQVTLFLTSCLHVLGNSYRMYIYWKNIDWKLTAKFGLVSILMSGIGAQISDSIPKSYFSLILGIFLISISILFWKEKRSDVFQSKWSSYIAGGLSGFLTGALGSGGAVRSLALSSFKLTPFSFTATSTVIDLGGDLLRLNVYLSKGYADQEHLFYLPIFIIVVFISNW